MYIQGNSRQRKSVTQDNKLIHQSIMVTTQRKRKISDVEGLSTDPTGGTQSDETKRAKNVNSGNVMIL
jgi:hypothetical protein